MTKLTGDKATFRYADYAGMPVEGFQAHLIDGWTSVSQTQLVVWTGVNDAYLIKVWNTCQDLQYAEHVGITSTASRVSTFEKVRVGRETCPISEIRPIDVKRMRADRQAAADANKP